MQEVKQLAQIMRRPKGVQFDLNLNKTTAVQQAAVPLNKLTMPPLIDSLTSGKTKQGSHIRATNNNSCTGGSTDAKNASQITVTIN